MIDVAIFGAGRIGKIHAGNLVRQAGVRLRYVVDPDAKAAAGARRAARRARSATARPRFADTAVRAVVIASSTDTHADLIERAAAAGKAIFCEKPVDLALDRARRCAEAVERAGVTCLIGFQRRYDPTFAAAKARLDAGEIGDARDAGRHQPRSRRAAGRVHQALRRHLQGHADPRLRHLPLDPRRRGGDRLRDRQRASPTRRSATVGRRRRDRGDDPHAAGPARADQHDAPRRLRLRPALRGAGRQGHAAGRQPPPDRGRRRRPRKRVSADKPEHFFLERYRVAYAHRDGALLRRARAAARPCARPSRTA